EEENNSTSPQLENQNYSRREATQLNSRRETTRLSNRRKVTQLCAASTPPLQQNRLLLPTCANEKREILRKTGMLFEPHARS
ncbi:hypothetical protein TNIN_244531, partial [Trichonephila inaurata madagascariensis]